METKTISPAEAAFAVHRPSIEWTTEQPDRQAHWQAVVQAAITAHLATVASGLPSEDAVWRASGIPGGINATQIRNLFAKRFAKLEAVRDMYRDRLAEVDEDHNDFRQHLAELQARATGTCSNCGGNVNHRPNQPGEFDYECSPLVVAMKTDFHQYMVDSMTPDRGYAFPTDHVRELFAKLEAERDKLIAMNNEASKCFTEANLAERDAKIADNQVAADRIDELQKQANHWCVMYSIASDERDTLRQQLAESLARESQLREACKEAYSVFFDPGENEPRPNTLGWDAVEKLRQALTLPHPPVIAMEDALVLIAGAYQRGHNDTVESCYADSDEVAQEALDSFRTKYSTKGTEQ